MYIRICVYMNNMLSLAILVIATIGGVTTIAMPQAFADHASNGNGGTEFIPAVEDPNSDYLIEADKVAGDEEEVAADQDDDNTKESGFDHGCDDADKDFADRYLSQEGKGANSHTSEFMNAYEEGLEKCSEGLPACDGSFQDCVTARGDVCFAGSKEHKCELED
jgi:hypothetical protein